MVPDYHVEFYHAHLYETDPDAYRARRIELRRMLPAIIPAGAKHVYQGGLHDVYCDGQRHLWAQGGSAEFPYLPKRIGGCDCSYWGNHDVSEVQRGS